MLDIAWLDPRHPEWFPDVKSALQEPNGLLAAGGDLSPQRLINAYRLGIFPWYSEGQPILWWSPDPRLVLFPRELHVSRSLVRTIRQAQFSITLDTAFEQVIRQCSQPRKNQDGTWITEEMIYAYCQLHTLGWAHSVECWQNQKLVGGLYGVAIGKVFFGESMFSTVPNSSKVAFVHLLHQLIKKGYRMIDCQVETSHLEKFGAKPISRIDFIQKLAEYGEMNNEPHKWELDTKVVQHVESVGGVL